MLPFMAAGMAANVNWGKVAKWGGVVVAGAIIFFIIRKQFKRIGKNISNQQTNIVTGSQGNANVLADRARAAMKGWGTNENALFDVASIIAKGQTTFELVAAAYYKKYGRNLSEDLVSELSSSELKQFYSTMGKPVEGLGAAKYLY